ncbi:MAG: hypothetical protein KBS52_04820 [Clostridiales bacterium]|nr:hypothetical protein [Candidatus Equinaster intestinalis]
MKTSTKKILLISALLFGIILKIAVLFVMPANHTFTSEVYPILLSVNYLMVGIFLAFIFGKISGKIKKDSIKILVATGFAIWSYVAVLFENTVWYVTYLANRFAEGGDFFGEFPGGFLSCFKESFQFHAEYALFTLLLCGFVIAFSGINAKDAKEYRKEREIKIFLTLLFVADIIVKVWAYHIIEFEPIFLQKGFLILEKINYLLDAGILVTLFAVFNRRIEKTYLKIIFAAILSVVFICTVINENVIFSDKAYTNELLNFGISSFAFLLHTVSGIFKSGLSDYLLVTFDFFVICLVHILFSKYDFILERKNKDGKIAGGNSAYELSFTNDEGEKISGMINEISSIKIGSQKIVAGKFTRNDGGEEYVCLSNNGDFADETVTVCENEQEMLKEYALQISKFSEPAKEA